MNSLNPNVISCDMIKHKIIFLLLFLNGYLIGQVDHWEMVVYNDDVWNFFPGNSEPPLNWNSLSFNDSFWESAIGGIGYGDEDDSTIIDPVNSLYLRHKFSIIDKSDIKRCILHADYDDSFVAYLNGEEIFRSNVNGEPPRHDTWANENHEASLYRGLMPEAYELDFENIENLLVQGENLLSIQVHNFEGTNSSDLSTNFYISAGMESSVNNYRSLPQWFQVPFEPVGAFTSPLAIIRINTNGQDIFDEPSIPGTMSIIWNESALNSSEGDANEFFGNISIEKRGQSSLFLFPKNGYGIETKDENGEDMDASFLGFPEEEDWILHGPYSDKTLMRNVLALHLANSISGYHSRTRFIELIINDSYEGIYVLMEKIKQDDNRVDIADLDPEDIFGDELTGGYVFKIDKDEPDWFSNFEMLNANQNLSFQYVSPKASKIVPEQKNYIKSYVDSFERALIDPSLIYAGKRYDEYVDINSFVDHMIVKELSKDIDAYRISSYYHKKKDSNGGKIHAGPVWDFNLGFANADYCDAAASWGWQFESPSCGNTNPFWYKAMYDDLVFRNLFKCRWNEVREGPFSYQEIENFIDDQVALLEPALERNFNRWPVLGQYIWPNSQVFNSYSEEVNYMKGYIEDRLEWMDRTLGACVPTSIDEPDDFNIEVYPNPFSGELHFDLPSENKEVFSVEIFNPFGQLMLSQEFGLLHAGNNHFSLNDLDLIEGIYICRLQIGETSITKKINRF